MTKYPNLLAEYEARSWFCHIASWANRANVSTEIMKEVLYNGAELTPEEIKGFGHDEMYISSPELTLIDTNNKMTRSNLDKFIEWFNNTPKVFDQYPIGEKEYFKARYSVKGEAYYQASVLADAYLAGKPISMAIYRAGISAKDTLEFVLKPQSTPRGSKVAGALISLPAGSNKPASNIQVVEYKSGRVLTTQQLAEGYGTEPKIINNNFNRNIERYKVGKHFYCLEGEDLKKFKAIHQIDEQLKFATKLYLWTEKGALLHAKSLNTDKAWEVYDMLVETYFRVKTETYTSTPTPSRPENRTYAKKIELEAKLNNSHARIAREAFKIAARPEVPEEYKKVLYAQAIAALTGNLTIQGGQMQ